MSDWLSVPEAARRAGVCPVTMRRYIRAGEIAHQRVGCGDLLPRYRLRPEWVDEFVASRTVSPARPDPKPAREPRPPRPVRPPKADRSWKEHFDL